MEKQSFTSLARRALARSRDGRFMWLVVVETLLGGVLAAIPLAVFGVPLLRMYRALKCGEEPQWNWLLLALPLWIVWLILSAWLMSAIHSGVMREALHPAPARVGRAFRNGFSMLGVVLFPLPWAILASSVSGTVNGLADALVFPVYRAIPLLLLWLVSLALGIVTHFLYCGVAAGGRQVRFGELYTGAFRAFRNGWGRFVLGWLAICGFVIVCILSLLPALICYAFGRAQDSSQLTVAAGALFAAWCVGMVLASLKVCCFSFSYFLYLYLDAAGIRPELEESSGRGEAPELSPTAASEPAAEQNGSEA